jgi:hypothetical protein
MRVQGRNAQGRAEFHWLPVAKGMTPHGMRHAGRTWMEEQRVHRVLAETQMRHELGGIEVYRHVTDAMRDELRERLQAAWLEALARRGDLSPRSPVKVLDTLLQGAASGVTGGFFARISQERVRLA